MTKEFADVAQLVEQLIRNQQVNGSSPFVGSIHSMIWIVIQCVPVSLAGDRARAVSGQLYRNGLCVVVHLHDLEATNLPHGQRLRHLRCTLRSTLPARTQHRT